MCVCVCTYMYMYRPEDFMAIYIISAIILGLVVPNISVADVVKNKRKTQMKSYM